MSWQSGSLGSGIWRGLSVVLALSVLVTAAEAQSLDFGGRFTDTLGRNMHAVTGRGIGFSFTFTNERTGETHTRSGQDASLDGAGNGGVTFSQGVSAGDTIRCSASVEGSATTTLLSPARVVLTADDLSAGRVSSEFVVGGPAGARSLVFGAQFVDALGRNLHPLTSRGIGTRVIFRNTRSGEQKVLAGQDQAMDGDGITRMAFDGGGNQSARVGDTIEVSVELTGSQTTTLSDPRSFLVTAGDILTGSTPIHRIVTGGEPWARSLQFNVTLRNVLGQNMHTVTNRGIDTEVRFRNTRSGEVLVAAGQDQTMDGNGNVIRSFTAGGNQSAKVGDRVEVSVKLSGSTTCTLSYPSTFIVTSGDITRGATPFHLVMVGGGVPSTRNLSFVVKLVDALGQNMHTVTNRGEDTRVTFTNTRSGETKVLQGQDQVMDGSGYSGVNFNGSNQAAQVGDVINVSVRLTGSATSTQSNPDSFVVTTGDIDRGTTLHEVVVGGAPAVRRQRFSAILVDPLGQNIHSVTNRGVDLAVTFTNTRSGETRRLAGQDQVVDGSGVASVDFGAGGNQSARVGDPIAVSVTQYGSATSTLSWPSSFVLTSGDILTRATPVHRIVVGGAPSARTFTFRTQWVDALGQNLHPVTNRGVGTRLVFTNTRSGEVREVAGQDQSFDGSGITGVLFSAGGGQSMRAGDVIRIDPQVGGGSGGSAPNVHSFPATIVVTPGDVTLAQGQQSPIHRVQLTSPPFRKSFTVSGKVGVSNNQPRSITVRNVHTGESVTLMTDAGGNYGAAFSGTTSQPAVSEFDQFSLVGGPSFIADNQDVRTGQRTGFNESQGSRTVISFSGFVRDALNRPVPAATVAVVGLGVDTGFTRGLNASTGPGNFFFTLDLPPLGPGNFTMRVTAPGHAPFEQTFTLSQAELTARLKQLDIILPDAVTPHLRVRGRVRDGSGRVLDGVTVTARALGTGLVASARTPTSTDTPGTYSLDLTRPSSAAVTLGESVLVRFSHPVLGSIEQSFTVTAGPLAAAVLERDLTFHGAAVRRFRVTGTIRDGTGRPVNGVSVRASTNPTAIDGEFLTVEATTPTNPDLPGTYSLDLEERGGLGMSSGRILTMEVRHPGLGYIRNFSPEYQVSGLTGSFGDGRRLDFRFPTVRTRRFLVEGIVVDGLDRPVDGAQVSVTLVKTGRTAYGFTPAPTGAGRFRLLVDEPIARDIQFFDKLRLGVTGPGFPPYTRELGLTLANFKADGTGELTGLRVALPEPARNRLFEVIGFLRDPAGQGRNGVLVPAANPRTGATDSSFTPALGADDSLPGLFRIVLTQAGGDGVRVGDTLQFPDVTYLGVTRPVRPNSVVLTAQEVLSQVRIQQLTVDLPAQNRSFSLAGRLLDVQDRPIDRAAITLVNVRTGRSGTVLTPSGDGAGSFVIPVQDAVNGAVAAGETWRLSAGVSGLPTATYDLLFSEAEVRAGRAFRALKVGGQVASPPHLAGVSPAGGPRSQPTPVILTGTGFSAALGARLGSAEPTLLSTFQVLSDTRATAVVPAGLPVGSLPLVVFSQAGASNSLAFNVSDPFAAPPAARITLFGRNGGGAQTVQLDGSASTGESLVYEWTLAARPAGAAALSAGSAVVGYAASVPGTYRFRLAVADARGRMASSELSFAIAASPPRADLQAPFQVVLRDPRGVIPAAQTTDVLWLDGSRSFEPSSPAPLAFQWSLLAAPPGSSVTSTFGSLTLTAASLAVSLVATETGGRLQDAGLYVFGLAVTGTGGTSLATAAVQVLDPNRLAPRADAGLEQTVLVTLLQGGGLAATIPDDLAPPPENLRPFIRLDGHESSDPSGRPLEYRWRFAGGPAGAGPVTLSEPASARPTFAAVVAGFYTFGLIVDNGTYESREDQVTVNVTVRSANKLPTADVVARTRGAPVSVQNRPRAELDQIELDATASADEDDLPPLTYLWRQVGGRPVTLVPSASAAKPRFVAPAPDTYAFELVVTDGRAGASMPVQARVQAIAARGEPPALRLVSSASTTVATGEGFALTRELLYWLGALLLAQGDDFSLDEGLAELPRTLRVKLPTTVTLSLSVSDPAGGGAQGAGHAVQWQQILGPTTRLREVPASQLAPGVASAVQFEPTTSRVHVFRARAIERDSGGETGVKVDRYISVIVDSPRVSVPVAAFQVIVAGKLKGLFSATTQAKAPVVRPKVVVTLDGRGSSDRNVPPRPLSFRWVQTAGPLVVLSNATSPVTSFVVPRLTSRLPQRYGFALFVDNGDDRSEPAPGSIQAVSETGLAVEPGLNLISLPVNPSTTDRVYNSDDLLRDTAGSTFVARVLPTGKFEVHTAETRSVLSPFPIEGNKGYLMGLRGGQALLAPDGPDWGAGARSTLLRKGLNLVGYPAPVPAGATAETLRALTNASVIVVVDSGGRFLPYSPGLTPPFPIVAGQAILLVVPADVTLPLPAGQ